MHQIIEQEEMLSTKVTADDIENGVADEYGVVYSKDGKRLLQCNDDLKLKTYIVKNATKVICDKAFFVAKIYNKLLFRIQ